MFVLCLPSLAFVRRYFVGDSEIFRFFCFMDCLGHTYDCLCKGKAMTMLNSFYERGIIEILAAFKWQCNKNLPIAE